MVKSGRNVQRIIGPAAALAALFVIMLFCLGTDSGGRQTDREPKEPIVLHLWYPWANEENALRKPFLESVDEFNRDNTQIQIEAEGIEEELYRTKLPTAVATNDTPDIYFCYGDEYLKNIASSGKILKLNRYLDEDMKERLKPGALENMKYEDGFYGMGFREAWGVFLINREMFQMYGLSAPENQEELVEVCRAFLDRGIVPLACSADERWGYSSYLQAICLGMAGEESCRRIISGNSDGGEENFAKGLECFIQLKKMGAFGDSRQKKTTQEIENEFYLSRIPMYYAPSEFISNIILENCPLYHKIEAAAFPVSNGYKTVLGGISEAFVINSAVRYPKETVFALSHLAAVFSEKLYEAGAGLPTWKTERVRPPQDEVWKKANEIYLSAEEKMGNWGICLGGKQAELVNEVVRDFIEEKISAEELMNKLK